MKIALTQTDASGEVYNLSELVLYTTIKSGWYANKNGSNTVFIPYSSSFEINGVSYMVTTKEEALRLGRIMIRNNEVAEVEIERK